MNCIRETAIKRREKKLIKIHWKPIDLHMTSIIQCNTSIRAELSSVRNVPTTEWPRCIFLCSHSSSIENMFFLFQCISRWSENHDEKMSWHRLLWMELCFLFIRCFFFVFECVNLSLSPYIRYTSFTCAFRSAPVDQTTWPAIPKSID